MNQYESNFKWLMELLSDQEYQRIENNPFPHLTVEKLQGTGFISLISLCQWGKLNGDLIRDPEVLFVIGDGEAKPIFFRNDSSIVCFIKFASHFL